MSEQTSKKQDTEQTNIIIESSDNSSDQPHVKEQQPKNKRKLKQLEFAQQYQQLTVYDVFVLCARPQYMGCQLAVGCMEICCAGQGLAWCCCCYGTSRSDCGAVMCAGCVQSLTSPFVVGCISSFIVGIRMMDCVP